MWYHVVNLYILYPNIVKTKACVFEKLLNPFLTSSIKLCLLLLQSFMQHWRCCFPYHNDTNVKCKYTCNFHTLTNRCLNITIYNIHVLTSFFLPKTKIVQSLKLNDLLKTENIAKPSIWKMTCANQTINHYSEKKAKCVVKYAYWFTIS